MRRNPFVEAGLSAEIFDEQAVLRALMDLLYDEPTHRALADRRADYLRALALLPSAADAVRAALRRPQS
ncbi:DUF6365 family protein [Amycolatopsis sp. cmx-11-32]|uniref:DUF6365 family protein n=1 Tax=Amycolatopsis sp. cmx-11-32 TaxID=2785796 RepID=UPI0039E651DE